MATGPQNRPHNTCLVYGSQLSKDQCKSACEGSTDKSNIVKCIHDAPCDQQKMGARVQ